MLGRMLFTESVLWNLNLLLVCVLAVFTVSLAQNDGIQLEIMPKGEKQFKAIGDNLFLSCLTRGLNPPPELRWEDESGQPIEGDSRKYSENIPDGKGLFVKQIKEEDEGTYRCTTMYNGEQLSQSVLLTTYTDITWSDAPEVQNPVVGEEGLIKCKVVAKPKPTVDWYKGLETFKSDDRCKIVNDGILCDKIETVDNGQYICRARVSDTGRLQERQIKVDVFEKPSIQNIKPTVQVVEGNKVTLDCSGYGKPIPQYSWFDKNNNNLTGRSGYEVDSEDGTLIINSVTKEDEGTLKCIARNSAGEKEGLTKLNVIVKPKIEKFDHLVVAEGEQASIKCHVKADPEPVIKIAKKSMTPFVMGEQPNDNHIELRYDEEEDAMVLQFTNVRRSDDGDYTCTAENSGGSVIDVGHLTVEFGPDLTQSPKQEEVSWKENSINLTCIAVSIPNATIDWFANGKKIKSTESNLDISDDDEVKVNSDQNYAIFGEGPNSTLQIFPVDESYFTNYTCRAKNKISESSHIITLKEARVPGRIEQGIFDKVTATTITFTFSGPSNNGGLEIDAYSVKYLEDGYSFDTDSDNIKQREWPNNNAFILEKLKPEKKYHFIFAAKNKVGYGEWTSPESHVMPRKGAPEEPKITQTNVNGDASPYHDHYELRWQVPADNGEKIDLFQIIYYTVQNSSTGKLSRTGNMITANVSFPGQPQYIIEKLYPDTTYRVELRARNVIGFSKPAEATFRTAQDPGSGNIRRDMDEDVDANNKIQLSSAGMPVGVTAAIIAVGVVILVIAVDLICFFVKKCGIIMCLCVHVCGRHPPSVKAKEAAMEEGKMKDSKEAKKDQGVTPCVTTNGHNDDPKDHATETTPMIDG